MMKTQFEFNVEVEFKNDSKVRTFTRNYTNINLCDKFEFKGQGHDF